MFLRLAAFGALGYAGYKYYEKYLRTAPQDGNDDVPASSSGASEVELAGGPLSSEATLIRSDEEQV